MAKISSLGVLRLRAVNTLLGDRSARRFAQDDGLVRSSEKHSGGVYQKTREIKKVTTSQHDGFVVSWRCKKQRLFCLLTWLPDSGEVCGFSSASRMPLNRRLNQFL